MDPEQADGRGEVAEPALASPWVEGFDAVLGSRRGHRVEPAACPQTPGLLSRLDSLRSDMDGIEPIADEEVEFFARGRGFDVHAHGTDSFLVTELGQRWSVAFMVLGAGRWQTYLRREVVVTARATGEPTS